MRSYAVAPRKLESDAEPGPASRAELAPGTDVVLPDCMPTTKANPYEKAQRATKVALMLAKVPMVETADQNRIVVEFFAALSIPERAIWGKLAGVNAPSQATWEAFLVAIASRRTMAEVVSEIGGCSVSRRNYFAYEGDNCPECHYVHGFTDDTCEYTRAVEEADIVQAGDELRVGPGMELDGVDVPELRRRLNLRGIALEANNVGGEPGYRAVRL